MINWNDGNIGCENVCIRSTRICSVKGGETSAEMSRQRTLHVVSLLHIRQLNA